MILLVIHVSSHQSLSSAVTSMNISSVGTHIHSSVAVSTVNSHTGLIVSTTDTGNFIIIRNILYYTDNSIIVYY